MSSPPGRRRRPDPAFPPPPWDPSPPDSPEPLDDLLSSVDPISPPPEFVCPISGFLMASPVTVPSGQTFESAAIQACAAFAFSPPGIDPPLNLTAAAPLPLVPNINLRLAILSWCDSHGLPHPDPLSQQDATNFVRRLMELSPGASPRPTPSTAPAAPPPAPPPPPLSEDDVINGARGLPKQRAEAMAALRRATRDDDAAAWRALCTPRVLVALRKTLQSAAAADSSAKNDASAALVNLSLEPSNKVTIARSGVLLPLVDLLAVTGDGAGSSEVRDNAVSLLYSLAADEESRSLIASLGVATRLLDIFAGAVAGAGYGVRREAGKVLFMLSEDKKTRRRLPGTPGLVRALLGLMAARSEAEAPGLRRQAMGLVASLADIPEGRSLLMEGGAVGALADAMRRASELAAASKAPEEEYCVAALYRMSQDRSRFRARADEARVEGVLTPVAEGRGGRAEMARRTLQVLRTHDGARAGRGDDGSAWLYLSDTFDPRRRNQPGRNASSIT